MTILGAREVERERWNWSADEKTKLLRRHLIERIPISRICEEAQLAPSLFHRWQEQLFQNAAAALEGKRGPERHPEQQRIEKLEQKIRQARIPGRARRFNKRVWGTLNGCWVEPDIRDAVMDSIRRWSKRTGLAIEQLLEWLQLSVGKLYEWRRRFGKANQHNGRVPRDF